jgi:hypothetical protein
VPLQAVVAVNVSVPAGHIVALAGLMVTVFVQVTEDTVKALVTAVPSLPTRSAGVTDTS